MDHMCCAQNQWFESSHFKSNFPCSEAIALLATLWTTHNTKANLNVTEKLADHFVNTSADHPVEAKKVVTKNSFIFGTWFCKLLSPSSRWTWFTARHVLLFWFLRMLAFFLSSSLCANTRYLKLVTYICREFKPTFVQLWYWKMHIL